MQHPSINYKTNHIYTFDSKEAKDFNNNGVDTVYYMPLCTNVERVQTLLNSSEKTAHEADNNINNQTTDFFKNSPLLYNYDISFVGNLYDKNRYDDTMHILPDYLCGYMDAAIEAQLNEMCIRDSLKIMHQEPMLLLNLVVRMQKSSILQAV